MENMATETGQVTDHDQVLIQRMRETLPLQQRARLHQEAELMYQTVRWGVCRRHIRWSLPWHPLKIRRVVVWRIREYPRFIPDEALLKFAQAEESRLFTSFWVAEPTYQRISVTKEDPWLIGLRREDTPPFWDWLPVSIIASWT